MTSLDAATIALLMPLLVAFALGVIMTLLLAALRRALRGSPTANPAPPAAAVASVADEPALPRVFGDDDEVGPDVTRVAEVPSPPNVPRLSLHDDAAGGSDEEDDGTPSASLVSYVDQLHRGRPAGERSLVVSGAGRTDVGRKRKRNEDRCLVVSDDVRDHYMFAVFDGMGGHQGGAVASRLAAEILRGKLGEAAADEKRPALANALVAAIEHANRVIWSASEETPVLKGMGTTVAAALFDPAQQSMYVAHVGDSRAYRLRRGRCEQLTKDHTIGNAENGVAGPMAGYLRRALGVRPNVKVDVTIAAVEDGDVYLLCTDGLTKMVKDQEIARGLSGSEDPEASATLLVDQANSAGGDDNVAVVVVRVSDARAARQVVSRAAPERRH